MEFLTREAATAMRAVPPRTTGSGRRVLAAATAGSVRICRADASARAVLVCVEGDGPIYLSGREHQTPFGPRMDGSSGIDRVTVALGADEELWAYRAATTNAVEVTWWIESY